MEIPEFLSKIYLGDRYCKSITIEGNTLRIRADLLSRIRGDGNWNYYNSENIDEGEMVFIGIEELIFTASGLVPNGSFGDFHAVRCEDDPSKFLVSFSIESINLKVTTGHPPGVGSGRN